MVKDSEIAELFMNYFFITPSNVHTADKKSPSTARSTEGACK